MNISFDQIPVRDSLAQEFNSARPFPLVVIDNFLPQDIADGLMAEIAAFDTFQKSNDYIFAKNKFESPRLAELGPFGNAVRDLLLSPDIAALLTNIRGRSLFVDDGFVGGGLHRGGEGSFLDMHVDFGVHPGHPRWIRELNILLYLNRNWKPEYGGELQLRHGQSGETTSVEPLFNRMVIMLTKDFTYHGYRRINFPTGTYRTSIAAYAYMQAETDSELENLLTTTKWVPENGNALKTAVAKVTPSLVSLKQRMFGSATAKKK